MRAVRVEAHGGPEVLVPSEVPEPDVGAEDVLVDVAAAGVNYIDTYLRSGLYPSTLPTVPGLEGAGTVRAVGSSVSDVAVGDVVAFCDGPGAYAETAAVPAARCVPVPPGVSADVAAAVLLQGLTAHVLVHDTYAVRPGDTVLVHAGAGGMGLLLCQMASSLGATVVATTSTAEKASLARSAGAAHVLGYEGFAEEVRALTSGDGVAAVYDGVGATTFDGSLASLRVRGVLVLYGAASGPVPPVDPQRLNAAGSVYLTRPSLGWHVRTTAELRSRAAEVFAAVADGSLSVRIGARYPLEAAADAHRDLEGRATSGKLLLVPSRG
ncbi:quinone oxidoreductase [Actinomycetospora corticicola]|uniref:NADPH2:quinone reductase n=1 Tax=Actinomycetospora corticicola TaxID=663602 RepID=A0A7Y9DTW0_9PSEU|nr:quinone oxidoreductase [Actinomycetospora corticicola]NYD35427.1 NADPH2:quinone reductase [Actinomycetospora corticicola]